MTSPFAANDSRNQAFAAALRRLARGLWLLVGGTIFGAAAVVGVLLMDILRPQGQAPPPWLPGAIIGAAASAAIFNLAGKYMCFGLRKPVHEGRHLPGYRALRFAFWGELIGVLMKGAGFLGGFDTLNTCSGFLVGAAQLSFFVFLGSMVKLIADERGKSRFVRMGCGQALAVLLAIVTAIVGSVLLGMGFPLAGELTLAFAALAAVVAFAGYNLLLIQVAAEANRLADYLNFGDDLFAEHLEDQERFDQERYQRRFGEEVL